MRAWRASAGHGRRPLGHLDDGISVTLRGRAGQVLGPGRIAVDGAGVGPVLFEQGAFEPSQLAGHDGPVARAEPGLEVEDPVEGLRCLQVPISVVSVGTVLRRVVIGDVAPVRHHPAEVVEGQRLTLRDQTGLVSGEQLGDRVVVRRTQHVDVIDRQPPLLERHQSQGHGPQLACPTHLRPSRRRCAPGVAGQPGRHPLQLHHPLVQRRVIEPAEIHLEELIDRREKAAFHALDRTPVRPDRQSKSTEKLRNMLMAVDDPQ